MPKNDAKGFAWISYETNADQAYITVDAMQRLYLSSAAAKLLNLETPGRLYVGYDHANMRLVAAKPELVKATDVKPFKFDKRRYCRAQPFIKALGIDKSKLPMRFTYVGKDFSDSKLPDGSFSFQLDGFDAADE